MSYREALANSLNIAAVKVLQRIGGPEKLAAALTSAGITTLSRAAEEYGLGLTIGNAEVPLLELTNAYATLARGGQFLTVRTRRDDAAAAPSPRFDSAACWLLADVLADPAARVRAFGETNPLRLPFPAAVKTGTSTDYRDNWTVGFTPEFTVGVWMGNFDRAPMQDVSGVTGAAPLWRDIMLWLAEHRAAPTWLAPSDRLVEAEIDPVLGCPPAAAHAAQRPLRSEWFLDGTVPTPAAADRYDAAGRVRLARDYAGWLAGPYNWLGPTAIAADVPLADRTGGLRILSPLPGTTVLLDPDLPGRGALLKLRANRPATTLRWTSPTLPVETTAGRTHARLREGRHEFLATDPTTGQTQQTWINVRGL
jgi:penicillin-binding protein 1C